LLIRDYYTAVSWENNIVIKEEPEKRGKSLIMTENPETFGVFKNLRN